MSYSELKNFDSEIKREKQIQYICGIDEAGRGPLAGVVSAGCVYIASEDFSIEELNDSKKLSEKKREKIFDFIDQSSDKLYYGYGTASVEEIDEYNILNATYMAMQRAYNNMIDKLRMAGLPLPTLALIDGNLAPKLPIETVTVVKGDAKSASIASASIVAKVLRDRYMLTLAEEYPEYMFEKHKGYGTKLHYEKIMEYGISPVHRLSFLKKITGEK